MSKIVVIGAAGMLGHRVVAQLAADHGVDEVTAVDETAPLEGAAAFSSIGSGRAIVRFVELPLTDAELKRHCDGASTFIHLGVTPAENDLDDLDGTGMTPARPDGIRHVLDVAADVGVRSIVVLSSAMVYGAWPNNPIPLTEDAPLRPDAALRFAAEHAEVERIISDWHALRAASNETRVAVAILRPAITVDRDRSAWLARSPWSTDGVQVRDSEPPKQFLYLDDLVSAIDTARRGALDGPFNVAPDGWIPAEQLRDLSGPAPRVHVPAAVAHRIGKLRWTFGLTGTPPEVLSYTISPWVIANDRLRAAGWEPSHSNEEAFVEADRGGPLSSLNPRRTQMLSIGAVVGVVAALVTGVILLVRRSRRD